jgi:hypothetical protein
MAMLVTGRTLDEMRGEEYEVAREQVLSYLDRPGWVVARPWPAGRPPGLSEVRIEPTVIANEADPSARLTVGQDLTDQLKLVYSTNLTDSNDQIWVAEYDVTAPVQGPRCPPERRQLSLSISSTTSGSAARRRLGVSSACARRSPRCSPSRRHR